LGGEGRGGVKEQWSREETAADPKGKGVQRPVAVGMTGGIMLEKDSRGGEEVHDRNRRNRGYSC